MQEMAKLLENHGTPVFFCRVVAGDPGRLQIEDPACPDTPNLPTFDVAHDVHQFAQTLATIGVRHIHVQHLAGMSTIRSILFAMSRDPRVWLMT